jgi:hypothetical protein
MALFKSGDMVRLSQVARDWEICRGSLRDRIGRIVRDTGRDIVTVRWDGRTYPATYHRKFLELVKSPPLAEEDTAPLAEAIAARFRHIEVTSDPPPGETPQ